MSVAVLLSSWSMTVKNLDCGTSTILMNELRGGCGQNSVNSVGCNKKD